MNRSGIAIGGLSRHSHRNGKRNVGRVGIHNGDLSHVLVVGFHDDGLLTGNGNGAWIHWLDRFNDNWLFGSYRWIDWSHFLD